MGEGEVKGRSGGEERGGEVEIVKGKGKGTGS